MIDVCFVGNSSIDLISSSNVSKRVYGGSAIYSAFACRSLSSVTIGSGVTYIGNYAFYNCSGLTEVTIPSSVRSIGGYAFLSCTGLTSVASLSSTAPLIENTTFNSIKPSGTLYVPNGNDRYEIWLSKCANFIGYYNWTKVEQ